MGKITIRDFINEEEIQVHDLEETIKQTSRLVEMGLPERLHNYWVHLLSQLEIAQEIASMGLEKDILFTDREMFGKHIRMFDKFKLFIGDKIIVQPDLSLDKLFAA